VLYGWSRVVYVEVVEMDGNQDIGLEESLNGPARAGAELRVAREGFGWSLGDVAARLKIRLGFLEAIESGDLAALPAPTYAAGFIRSYADALGLDPNDILHRFRAGGMSRARSPMLVFPEAIPDRGVPPGALALLVAVIAIGGYVIWYGRSERQMRVADTVPSVPAQLAPLALSKPAGTRKSAPSRPAANASKATMIAASAPPHASRPTGGAGSAIKVTSLAPLLVAPKPRVSGLASAKPAPAPENASKPALAPLAPSSVSAEQAPVQSKGVFQPSSVPQLPIPPPAVAAPSGNNPASGALNAAPANMVIVAALRSWVEIRNVRGKILFSRVMEPGESWQLPDQPGLTITTGNAGGIEFIRNGVPGPPLGPSGSVVHSALITPSGTIVPPPQPFRVRHFYKPPPPRRQHWANPFAVPITGDQ
jgi:cytoskeleton protein RodZ